MRLYSGNRDKREIIPCQHAHYRSFQDSGTLQQNQTKHDTARRQARRYIRDFATEEDISELKTWIELVEQRKNEEIK